MNFDWFHVTQVEESDNHELFFECKRRHFSIKNTTATRPRHNHSTGSTVLPLGLAQPKEQPRLLQQLSRFYLLPFPRKKLGYLTTWTPHVMYKEVQTFPLLSFQSFHHICFLIPVLCGLGARPLLIFRGLVTILFCSSEHTVIVSSSSLSVHLTLVIAEII